MLLIPVLTLDDAISLYWRDRVCGQPSWAHSVTITSIHTESIISANHKCILFTNFYRSDLRVRGRKWFTATATCVAWMLLKRHKIYDLPLDALYDRMWKKATKIIAYNIYRHQSLATYYLKQMKDSYLAYYQTCAKQILWVKHKSIKGQCVSVTFGDVHKSILGVPHTVDLSIRLAHNGYLELNRIVNG